MIKHFLTLSAIMLMLSSSSYGSTDNQQDNTMMLQEMINKASMKSAKTGGKESVLELPTDIYHIYRESTSKHIYYISNTTTESENPDQTKHIGLWLKGVKNLVIEGNGSTIVVHGEVTSFVIDSCENITLRNLTIVAADPKVPEMTVTNVGETSFDAQVNKKSDYKIENGKLTWVGEGWSFHNGIAQLYDPQEDITWRCWYPINSATMVTEIKPGLLHFDFNKKPDVKQGQTFQMRDGIRDEVCGFINRSRNINLERLTIHNLNNFSILSQFSDNITYKSCVFEPEYGSGRTNAASADILHFSGCKGKITIENNRFVGAHDDPINVHGTHLSIKERVTTTQLKLRFMHGQTFGFEAFSKGDVVDVVDAHTLQPVMTTKIIAAKLISPREMIVTIADPLNGNAQNIEELVIENVTQTPDVEIYGNYFARISTRGILVTTRGKVRIYDNVFYKMLMSSILIADDARSWFESGLVRDVKIYRNSFIECAAPTIFIDPENDIDNGPVHRNITITNNRFETTTLNLLEVKSVSGLTFSDNIIVDKVNGSNTSETNKIDSFIKTKWSENIVIERNKIVEEY